METRRPLIVDVRRGSLEDGPGIRSVVFFKGCPLRCVFCHNPEAQRREPELAFAGERCLRCGACRKACPLGAIDLDASARIDRGSCDVCGRCASACPGTALRVIGRYWTVEELSELLLRDVSFYRHSGGGVTLSGGECTMFPDYLESLLRILKSRSVHVALQTSGEFAYKRFARQILPFVDLVFFDLKIADRAASVRHTGRSNERILTNLRKLVASGAVDVRPRVPVVPGITDSPENLTAIVECLCRLGAATVSLLPYNPLGLVMHARLGRAEPDVPARLMPPDEEERVFQLFREIVRAQTGATPAAC